MTLLLSRESISFEGLSNDQKLAFCASACERFLSNRHARVSLAKWNRNAWDGLRTILNRIWCHTTKSDIAPNDAKKLAEDCMGYVPDDEDPTWDGLPEAQYAGILVLITIDALAKNNFEKINEVSSKCFDCVRNYLLKELDTSDNHGSYTVDEIRKMDEKVIVADLYQKEIQRQIDDIKHLKEKGVSRQAIAEIKIESSSGPYEFHSF